MDFVPVTYTDEEKRRTRKLLLGWVGSGAVAIAQLPVVAAAGVLFSSAPVYFGSIGGALAGFMVVLASATSITGDGKHIRMLNRRDSIHKALNEHYGLNLTLAQFDALDYPETDPGTQFKTFGSVKIQDQVEGVNFVERTIYLTAANGELKLSESRDGKRFKELRPDRHALEAAASRSALSASV